jgi:hypothetical protein
MIGDSFAWSEAFQLRLLVYLLRDPEKTYDVVEPQFFSSPVHVEISRILKETYAAHGKQIQISRETLTELVRVTMGEKDSWKLYKRTVKELYEIPLTDKAILLRQTFEFARESRYRETLIAAEKDVSNGRFQRVHERIDELRTSLNGGSTETSIRALRDSLRQQMDKPPREVEWDVPGFFPARATILFGGRKGEGKSYLLQALGKASRKGSELVKRLPVMKKRLLSLVREGAQELYDQRFRELEFAHRKHS